MKKIVLIMIISLSLIATFTIIFISCNKENQEVFTNESTDGYTKSTIDSLFNEPIIIRMLANLSSYNISVNSHNILSFSSVADMDSVIKILYKTDLAFEDSLNLYPDQAVLIAFENYYGFNSLRKEIAKTTRILESRNALTDINDPDNHHVVNDYIRTILTKDAEIVIDNLIYVIYSDFSVIIKNGDYNLLDSIHANVDNVSINMQLDRSIDFFHDNNNIIIKTDGDEPSCTADFVYYKDNTNYLKYYFYSSSFGYNTNNHSFSWSITGPNTAFTSSSETFNYTFTNGGTMAVTLNVFSNGSLCSQITKYINVGSCTADFYYINSNDGKVKFYSNISANEPVLKYSWNFDDGNSVILLNSDGTTEHTYMSNNTYHVTLTIETTGGCTSTCSKNVEVKNAANCCISNDKEINSNYFYNNNNNKLKFVFKLRHIWPIRWITAKTVNYKKTKNGNWLLQRADKIGADYYGIYYDQYCNSSTTCYLNSASENRKNNRTYFITTESIGMNNYRVGKNSIQSWFLINNSGTNTSGSTGLSLHNKNCN